jgi:glutamyl-Q tRNA(Asp) synthetase
MHTVPQSISRCYTGRFAPSPTGPLHAGSLVAALASWLDARAHGGTWLVRIEDVDTPRCAPGAADEILRQLTAFGLSPDAPPVVQSARNSAYQHALDALRNRHLLFECNCTRKMVEEANAQLGQARTRNGELVYPGTCRHRTDVDEPYAWRLRVPAEPDANIDWLDRRIGAQQQNLALEVGDFVLKRSDGLWAYQLAVVVDDAEQGITHVVRGEDLADNTPRQIYLQRQLGYTTPQYLHTPLVLGANGEKLSKQNGAIALNTQQPLRELQAAAQTLTLQVPTKDHLADWLASAVSAWQQRWKL